MLRTYIDDEWGREMATTMMADVKGRAATPAGPPEHFAVRVADRLVAALGQAMLYATTNHDPQQPVPAMDLRQAAEAVSGLGPASTPAHPAGWSWGTGPTGRPATGSRADANGDRRRMVPADPLARCGMGWCTG